MKKRTRETATILTVILSITTFISALIISISGTSCETEYIETKSIEIIEENNGSMNSERFIEILEAETNMEHSPIGGCIATTITDSENIIVYGGGINSEEKVEVIK